MEIPLSEGSNTLFFQLSGKSTNPAKKFGDSRTGASIKLKTEEVSKDLILNGEPIDETIVAYGPFMMRTKKEVMEAFRDFQDGQMGNLVL